MKLIGIFGSSGFAREVNDIANDLGFSSIFVIKEEQEAEGWQLENKIIFEEKITEYRHIPFIIGIGENKIREKIWNKYKNDLNFINLIHPSATFGKGQRELIDLKVGVIVCAGARFTNNIEVGNFTIFNLNSTIGHDSIIEDFSNIAPGANISGNVHIGKRCWIGTGAKINQGNPQKKLLIDDDTTIGSGSVLIKNCDKNSVYVGVPARKIT